MMYIKRDTTLLMTTSIVLVLFATLLLATTHPYTTRVFSQSRSSTYMNMTAMQKHAEHIIDNLVTSEHIPLIGKLAKGDFILLMDLTPFTTSIEGHSHIAMKIPCDENGNSKLALITGVAPDLLTFDIGKAINIGTLNGKELDLSKEGGSCLYHAELPNGTTDIALVNIANDTLNFDEGGYSSVTVTVHATAIQHLASTSNQSH